MNEMSDGNPYQFRSVHGDTPDDEVELLDGEARVRIAAALDVSFRPMRAIATVALLVAIVLTFFAGTAFVIGIANRTVGRNMTDLMSVVSGLGIVLVLAGSAFLISLWLWACATAIGRARTRLTVASLASAVQAQSLFWRKLGILSLLTVAAVLGLLMLMFFLNQ